MKALAYILIVSLACMGINRFMHGMENPVPSAEISCQMDCCASQDDCNQQKDHEKHDADHECPPGCDCGCCFHLTAIQYQFMRMPGSEVQSYHYGSRQDHYQFDFFIPLFQPPRLV